MKKEPIRVLQIVGRMDRGGIESMIMNLYRHIDREKVQFDFLAHYGREAVYNEEIRALGGRIYEMPALKDETHVYYWRLFSYIKALHHFFKNHREYKVIHGHMTNTASIYMPIAKKYGVMCRISHSHNTRGKIGHLGVVTDFLQKSIHRCATDYFACSEAAKKWFYPEELIRSGRVKILANAVDAEKFRFDQVKRKKMREQLAVDDCLAVVCIGRLRPEKNHLFLIDVLQEMLKKRTDIVFILAGDGPCEEELKEKAKRYGVETHIKFLGMREDIPDILQAGDVFVLPSKWEGLPVTAIEAQASGLSCVVSDTITKEIDIINMVDYISLDNHPSVWGNALLEAASKVRKDTYEEIKASGYDINTTAPWLQEFYLKKHNEE